MLSFKLPQHTNIIVNAKFENYVKASSLILKNPLFSLKLQFTPSMCSVGLPYPVRPKVYMDRSKIQEDFAYCMFKLRFEASFEFPDTSDSLFNEHCRFIKTIQDMITDIWNWENEIERLKDNRVSDINRNILKMLSILENIKDKTDN